MYSCPLLSWGHAKKHGLGLTLCPCSKGSLSGSTALSARSCEAQPCPQFPRKSSSSSDTRFLLISSLLCPLTALGPVSVQQPGLQKNVNIKFYRTKAQHSLICNAFCMKCPFPRVCHWVQKSKMSLRNLVLLRHFLLHNSRLKVYFAFLKRGNEHKKHVDLFHGLYWKRPE